MDETLEQIQRFANERHLLYRLAAKQHLSVEQKRRLDELNFRLPMLWDAHRREYAARHLPIRFNAAQERKAA